MFSASFGAKVARRCTVASGLRQARSGEVAGFDDSLGKGVTLGAGIILPPRRHPKVVTAPRVYDQRSGRTWTNEAKRWRSPDR